MANSVVNHLLYGLVPEWMPIAVSEIHREVAPLLFKFFFDVSNDLAV